MAKTSGKIGFKETVQHHDALSKEIASRRFYPIYLLMGDEPHFIDSLAGQLTEGILNEAERAFNQLVLYGKDSDAGSVINLCRQVPMMGSFQVVIVREAQYLRGLEKLSLYTQSPSPTTILVLCHKEKNVDKRSQLYKHTQKHGTVFESVRPRDYEISSWLGEYVRSKGASLDPKAVAMLTDHLGADIGKITNELTKLLTYLPAGSATITADHIEQNIGISKEFNNFELTKALSERNIARALLIAEYFGRNAKDHPLLVTISSMFIHFQRIFILNYQRWLAKKQARPLPSEMELARILKLSSSFFLKEYSQAAAHYPNQKVFAILGLLRDYDLKSKGINTGQANDAELLKELLLKIFIL